MVLVELSAGGGTVLYEVELQTGGTVNMTNMAISYASNIPHPCYIFGISGSTVYVYVKSTLDQLYYNNFVATKSIAPPVTPPVSPPFSNSTNSTQKSITNGTVYSQVVDAMLSNAAITTANKIPASRKAIPFLCFLVSLDELWLYQYH